MVRPVRIEYPGAIYHVITRGNNRQRIFEDEYDRKTYLEKLSHYCELKEVRLLCYCLLSNHAHLLLETPKGNLSKFMQPFQTSYTLHFNHRHGHTGHVFEQRYKAFVVDKDNYLLQVSRYIHLNPVEAGLVKRPSDYRWSSYRAYIDEREVPGINKGLVLERLGSKRTKRVREYREFVERVMDKEECFKFPVVKQAFVGQQEFVDRILQQRRRSGIGAGRYNLGKVLDAVCKILGLSKEELRRATREEPIQRAREVLMYVARHYSDASLKEIAHHLGVRDISTVSHGVRRVENLLRDNREASSQLEGALKKIHSLIQA